MPAQIRGPVRMSYQQYVVDSTRQRFETVIRVLVPDDVERIERPRVVYALPSSPELSHRSGDVIETVLAEDLHNRHGMVVVAPTYAEWPWMTDLPDNPMFEQVLYFLEDVVPLFDRQYPGSRRLLVGYSKGGCASLQLLLRYPETFGACALFDSPIMKELPDQWEMPYYWGRPERYRDFAIPGLLRERGRELGDAPRIAVLGYANFGTDAPDWTFDHLAAGHELMDQLGIPHVYDNGTYRAHRWDSGWLAQAFAALDGMSS
jgi:pimeloyl-ACP methyl ester carboxylesterase